MQILRFLFLIVIIFSCSGPDQKQNDYVNWELPYEKSGFTRTETYEEAVEYCKKLDVWSDEAAYFPFGSSGQGYDLPLLVIDKNGHSDAASVRESGNAVMLIEANIHPGEPEGIDAGFIFIRDIVINNKYPDLLDHLTILFIPSFNVDGHRRFMEFSRINQNGPEMMGWRTTARNLNLNRDFLKADAVEMQAWLRLFNQWLPDFFIDLHTTDGADYQYVLTYGLETNGNMDSALTEWQKDVYIKDISDSMENSGFPIFPYVAFRQWHDPKSGLISWVAKPMLSEGYTAIQNRCGLLIETHMLKEYKKRVDASYQMILFSAKIVARDYLQLIEMNRKADEYVSSATFLESPLPLDFQSTDDSTIVSFKGIDYSIEMSELTQGPWYKYGTEKKEFMLAFFNDLKPTVAVKLPAAYILPPEWYEIAARLDCHGVSYEVTDSLMKIEVSSYKFDSVKWSAEPYEGRQKIVNFSMREIKEERVYPPGSFIIRTNQRTARVIAHIFEPKAPDSYIQWGFFNAIFEQKEYGETYVMERVAREMLEKYPQLAAEFEKKKADEPVFANDQWAICNWFYTKTPYMDDRMNVYPVGRIMDMNQIPVK